MDSTFNEESTVSSLCSVPDGMFCLLSPCLSLLSRIDVPSYFIHPAVDKFRRQNYFQPHSDGDVWEAFMDSLDLSFCRNITDQSCLKVYHKDPAQAFSHAPRPSNGDGRVSASPDQITFIRKQMVTQWLLMSICHGAQRSNIKIALLLTKSYHDDDA